MAERTAHWIWWMPDGYTCNAQLYRYPIPMEYGGRNKRMANVSPVIRDRNIVGWRVSIGSRFRYKSPIKPEGGMSDSELYFTFEEAKAYVENLYNLTEADFVNPHIEQRG